MRIVPVVMGDAPPLRSNLVALRVCLLLGFKLYRVFTVLDDRRDFKQNDIIFSRGIKFCIYGKGASATNLYGRGRRKEVKEKKKPKNIPSGQITEPISLPLYPPPSFTSYTFKFTTTPGLSS